MAPIESNRWTINPIKVKLAEDTKSENEDEVSHHYTSSENGDNESPCESPVKNEKYFKN